MAWTLQDLRYDRDHYFFKVASSTTDAETYDFTIPFGYALGTIYARRSGASAFSVTLDASTTDVPTFATAFTLTEGAPNANLVITTAGLASICTARVCRLTGGTLNGQTVTVYINLRKS